MGEPGVAAEVQPEIVSTGLRPEVEPGECGEVGGSEAVDERDIRSRPLLEMTSSQAGRQQEASEALASHETTLTR